MLTEDFIPRASAITECRDTCGVLSSPLCLRSAISISATLLLGGCLATEVHGVHHLQKLSLRYYNDKQKRQLMSRTLKHSGDT
jgi:hypothetical protein